MTAGPDVIEVLAPVVHERMRELAAINTPERLGEPDLLPWDQLDMFHQNVQRMITRIVVSAYDGYLQNALGFDPVDYQKGLQLIARMGQDRRAIMVRLGLEAAEKPKRRRKRVQA